MQKGENIRNVVIRNHLTDAVYVGDIQGDYEAACFAGISFIHAAYGFGKINTNVPKIHEISELPGIMETIDTHVNMLYE